VGFGKSVIAASLSRHLDSAYLLTATKPCQYSCVLPDGSRLRISRC